MAACYSIGLSIVLSFLGIIAAQFGEIFGTSNIFSEFGSFAKSSSGGGIRTNGIKYTRNSQTRVSFH